MTAQLIDGKKIAATIREEIKLAVAQAVAHGKNPPGLAVILVGNDPASEVYVRNKRLACEAAGLFSDYYHLPDASHEDVVRELILKLNQDPRIHGILLQLPLPKQMQASELLEAIAPEKDVDGFHPYNLGRLAQRNPLLRPCTPFGIMLLLQSIKQQFKGKHAVVVGASNIVGRPIALELLIAGATVTVCHRFTEDLSQYVRTADILVTAVGKPDLIQGEWIKPGATVIDVGLTRLANNRLVGDVEFQAAADRAAWITPVPGGVGPMTVAILLLNTLTAAGIILSPELKQLGFT